MKLNSELSHNLEVKHIVGFGVDRKVVKQVETTETQKQQVDRQVGKKLKTKSETHTFRSNNGKS